MARSSTRQALKKGGNYMGMMTVLMQLRKVCGPQRSTVKHKLLFQLANLTELLFGARFVTTQTCLSHVP
jgi:hypothetical protein